MSDQWLAFIEARLDDLELASRGMVEHLCDGGERGFDLDGLPAPVRRYILRVTPARTDAVVAGLRQILALHILDTSRLIKEPFCVCQDNDGVVLGEWPCETVRSLAAMWAVDTSHPEYREEAR